MDISRRAAFTSLGVAAPLALSACASAQTTQVAAPSSEQWSAWLTRYGAAWTARDAAAAGALFSDNATYHEVPFDAPMQGRAAIEAYWTRVTASQSNIRFSYDVISFDGETGVAHWRTTLDAGADQIDLDGVFVCRFASADQVRSLQEWWHVKVTPGAS